MSDDECRGVSVLILTRNEADNLDRLLPAVAQALEREGARYEFVVVDAASPDGTADVARRRGARVVDQQQPGYANAWRQGVAECRGDYILALDADCSHRPDFIAALIAAIEHADIVVASRYVDGGSADMSLDRRFLSGVLNVLFARALGVPQRDLSSGFRIYRRAALSTLVPRGVHFDVLPEILALAHFGGLRIAEIPFRYHARETGVSKASVLKFAPAYLRTLLRCWRAKRVRPAKA
jgi:dolichol-phosphate mannosyltransferase